MLIPNNSHDVGLKRFLDNLDVKRPYKEIGKVSFMVWFEKRVKICVGIENILKG